MTPKQVVAAALRTNEYKLLTGRGYRCVSTERQLQNGTIRLVNPHAMKEITVTCRGIPYANIKCARVSSNRHTYVHTAARTSSEAMREGLRAAVYRVIHGAW